MHFYETFDLQEDALMLERLNHFGLQTKMYKSNWYVKLRYAQLCGSETSCACSRLQSGGSEDQAAALLHDSPCLLNYCHYTCKQSSLYKSQITYECAHVNQPLIPPCTRPLLTINSQCKAPHECDPLLNEPSMQLFFHGESWRQV